jgi:ribosomal protein S18 acetylase RimI-like enzyme
MKMEIKKINNKNIPQLVNIHNRTFSKDHFSSIFTESLLTDYFNHLLKTFQYSIAAFDSTGEIIGFIVAGNASQNVLNNFIKQNFKKLFLLILLRPRFWLEKLVELASNFSGKKKISVEKVRLYLIEIDPNFQSSGIGKEMILFLEKLLFSNHIHSYGLSVRKKNPRAIEFYKKNNFKIEFSTLKSVFFIKKINK